MKLKYYLFSFQIFLSLITTSEISAQNNYKALISDSLIRNFSDTISYLINKNDIPGLSISITDGNSILWADAFGVKKKDGGDSLNIETIFSLQSVSKAVTSTAVMLAVQEKLVSLDTPVVSYINNFTVNSKFEKDPEKKITLRHLLSHRAGFTHDAPVGNNYQTDFNSFEQHINSISNCWLKSEVGKLYSYSNLGIDLAGYILQFKSGINFEKYVKAKLFDPLGMRHSSFDWTEIRTEKNRAVGYDKHHNNIPLEFAMIPAGACYSNVLDLARFIQFHLSYGTFQGKVLLNKNYVDEMYRIPFTDSDAGYGLGIDVSVKNGLYEYSHSGGGFGFQSVIKWIPELNIGVAVLTNSADHNNIHKLIADLVIDKLRPDHLKDISSPKSKSWADQVPVTLSREKCLKYTGFYGITDGNLEFELLMKDSVFGAQGVMGFIPFNFINEDGDLYVDGFSPEIDGEYKLVMDDKTNKPLYLINKIDRPVLYFNETNIINDQLPDPEWAKYTGTYSRKMYDEFTGRHNIHIKNGHLYFDVFRLEEYLPGLF